MHVRHITYRRLAARENLYLDKSFSLGLFLRLSLVLLGLSVIYRVGSRVLAASTDAVKNWKVSVDWPFLSTFWLTTNSVEGFLSEYRVEPMTYGDIQFAWMSASS